ncbi:MAG: glycosyltransferase family 4 protein [Candidatus Heimdallarchaeum endolithica]|uniref:Glycosyltransferase family 4 protein n=1 Tax=Candidatus Heimdallarchaeum endolithica TaxID=2876572 RepID=A0A9Y1BSB5_9ARCH|nr:MAG: glycosyltransferase family 4 protein [Candidatus Heimdallarchaeum endolithica]
MNIAIIYYQLVNSGGGERLLIEEVKYFQNKGNTVSVLTFEFDKRSLFGQKINVVQFKRGKSYLTDILQLRLFFKKKPHDLIIANGAGGAALAYLATRGLNIPYITHIHGSKFWDRKEKIKYSFLFRKVFDKIYYSVIGHQENYPKHRNFSIIEKMKLELRSLIEYFGVKNSLFLITLTKQVKWELELMYKTKTIVSRPGVSKEFYLKKNISPTKDIIEMMEKIGNENKMILCVNRIEKNKRLDLVMKAFNELCNKRDDIFLVIAGRGNYLSEIMKLKKKLEYGSKIIFTGFVSEDDLKFLYKSCDIFVSPMWCAYGLTPIEAVVMKKKVLIANDSFVHEILCKNPLVKISEPNMNAFSENLLNLLKTTETINSFKMELPTWDSYFDKIEKELHECLNYSNQ